MPGEKIGGRTFSRSTRRKGLQDNSRWLVARPRERDSARFRASVNSTGASHRKLHFARQSPPQMPRFRCARRMNQPAPREDSACQFATRPPELGGSVWIFLFFQFLVSQRWPLTSNLSTGSSLLPTGSRRFPAAPTACTLRIASAECRSYTSARTSSRWARRANWSRLRRRPGR